MFGFYWLYRACQAQLHFCSKLGVSVPQSQECTLEQGGEGSDTGASQGTGLQ